MKIPGTARKRPGEPMGPLVDVVFLLLLFFLLAGAPGPIRPFDVALPVAENAKPHPRESLSILLAADGRFALDGRILEMEALVWSVAAQREGEAGEPLTVRVEADAEVSTGQVLALLERLRSVGVGTFRLSAHEGP